MQLEVARQLAIELMNVWMPDYPWHFEFDNAKRRFGCCNFTNRKITLSRHLVLLNTENEVRDTILHEIAHALAGSKAGHGWRWREMCLRVGAKPQRCYSSAEVATPKKKYRGVCPSCSRVSEKHRRGKVACGRCCRLYNGGKFTERYLIKWSVVAS